MIRRYSQLRIDIIKYVSFHIKKLQWHCIFQYNSTADALATCEADARAMRDGLQRAAAEREGLVRQNGCREIEATRLRESLDAKIHELQASKERLNDSEAHAETLRSECK